MDIDIVSAAAAKQHTLMTNLTKTVQQVIAEAQVAVSNAVDPSTSNSDINKAELASQHEQTTAAAATLLAHCSYANAVNNNLPPSSTSNVLKPSLTNNETFPPKPSVVPPPGFPPPPSGSKVTLEKSVQKTALNSTSKSSDAGTQVQQQQTVDEQKLPPVIKSKLKPPPLPPSPLEPQIIYDFQQMGLSPKTTNIPDVDSFLKSCKSSTNFEDMSSAVPFLRNAMFVKHFIRKDVKDNDIAAATITKFLKKHSKNTNIGDVCNAQKVFARFCLTSSLQFQDYYCEGKVLDCFIGRVWVCINIFFGSAFPTTGIAATLPKKKPRVQFVPTKTFEAPTGTFLARKNISSTASVQPVCNPKYLRTFNTYLTIIIFPEVEKVWDSFTNIFLICHNLIRSKIIKQFFGFFQQTNLSSFNRSKKEQRKLRTRSLIQNIINLAISKLFVAAPTRLFTSEMNMKVVLNFAFY